MFGEFWGTVEKGDTLMPKVKCSVVFGMQWSSRQDGFRECGATKKKMEKMKKMKKKKSEKRTLLGV